MYKYICICNIFKTMFLHFVSILITVIKICNAEQNLYYVICFDEFMQINKIVLFVLQSFFWQLCIIVLEM